MLRNKRLIHLTLIVWATAILSIDAAAQNATVTGSVHVKTAAHLQTSVVYVTGNLPKAAPMPAKTIEQKNKKFIPNHMVVTNGTNIAFPNLDRVFHNVFSLSPGNAFDLGLYRKGESRSIKLKKPGAVEIYCNVHERMQANILVVDNNFFAKPTSNGTYEITELPPGKYKVAGWIPGHRAVEKSVELQPGQRLKLDFTLPAPKLPKRHLNKDRLPYGRYK